MKVGCLGPGVLRGLLVSRELALEDTSLGGIFLDSGAELGGASSGGGFVWGGASEKICCG